MLCGLCCCHDVIFGVAGILSESLKECPLELLNLTLSTLRYAATTNPLLAMMITWSSKLLCCWPGILSESLKECPLELLNLTLSTLRYAATTNPLLAMMITWSSKLLCCCWPGILSESLQECPLELLNLTLSTLRYQLQSILTVDTTLEP